MSLPWVMFHLPCPTPDGQTAEDLYQKRVRMISLEMKGWFRFLSSRASRVA